MMSCSMEHPRASSEEEREEARMISEQEGPWEDALCHQAARMEKSWSGRSSLADRRRRPQAHFMTGQFSLHEGQITSARICDMMLYGHLHVLI